MMKNICKYILEHRQRIWWCILTISNIILIFLFRETLLNPPFSVDQVSLVTLVVLLFMPLVKEISFGTLKIKKELDSTKAEIQKDLFNFKLEMVQMSLNNNVQQSFQLYQGEAPSEEEIEGIEVSERKNMEASDKNQTDITAEELLYLKTRQMIEKKIKKISGKYRIIINSHSIQQYLYTLHQMNYIPDELFQNIKQVITICNRGIHGEVIDDKYHNFVERSSKDIIDKLELILELGKMDRYLSLCPRCKYTGPSFYDDQCPACGYLIDDE